MKQHTRFYEILGVSPNAGDDELKRAYHKAAMRYHPDKNPSLDAAEKFKEISNVYDVLSNKQKRSIYDQYGESGLKGQLGESSGMGPEDIFSQFFGGSFGGMGGGSHPSKGKDIKHTISCTLEELYNGRTSKLALNKTILCKMCNGLGGKENKVKKCSKCNGTGTIFLTKYIGPMISQYQNVCDVCRGAGDICNPKDRCTSCNGKKTQSERKILQVHIAPGMHDGQKIFFSGEGDQEPGVTPGDVIFVVEEKPHSLYTRKENDLYYEAEIDLLTGLAGGDFAFKHLSGDYIKIKVSPGQVISPGMLKVVEGQGMPTYKYSSHGNLFLKFKIKFPPNNFASAEKLKLLESILPPRTSLQISPDAYVEHVELVDVDPFKHKSKKSSEAYNSDEDDHSSAPHGVQCASQ